MAPMPTDEEAKCPVDHKTRQKWLDAAKSRSPPPPPPPSLPTNMPTARDLKRAEVNADSLAKLQPRILQMTQEQRNILLAQYQDFRTMEALHQGGLTRFSLDQSQWISSTPLAPPPPHRPIPREQPGSLSTDREVSSIPRARPTNHDRQPNTAEAAATPANNEAETGHDASGNWIYPSQSQFYAAMKRKGHDPTPADMSAIVPIHNAVNERAWAAIRRWEDAYTKHCGGPKLVSFSGDSKKLTPRARWRSLVGYEAPFDRHDWVVDRCGKRVEYVIDFYSGKQDGGKQGGGMVGMGPSFYLDVRPKLSSWEGVKTRAWRAVGS